MDEGEYQHSLYRHFHEHKILNQDALGRVRWIDVEGELWKYTKSKVGQKLSQDYIARDTTAFHLLKSRLETYIRRVHPHEWKKDNEDPYLQPFLCAIRANGNFKNIYTFNYTEVRSVLRHFANYTDEDMPRVIHIHGSTREKNIVLGIHDNPSIPEEYSFLRKSKQQQLYDLSADLLNADEIIIYGWSIGKTDGQYFEPFFRQMTSVPAARRATAAAKKRLTILTKGEQSVASIKRNIADMGICFQTLNDRLNFLIIDMGSLYRGSRSKEDYDRLIDRLKRGR